MRIRTTQAIIFLLFCYFSTLHASIIRVPQDQPTIQEGISSASHFDCDTVLVDTGRYYEYIWVDGLNSIKLGSLFLTTGDTTYISRTIIIGDSSNPVVYAGDGILVGFTITNGSIGVELEGQCWFVLDKVIIT